MAFNFIMLISLYPVLFIIYFVLKNEAIDKKNIILGVTIPKSYLKSEEVEQVTKVYQKRMNRLLLLFAWVPFVTFFIPYFSISFTIHMTWLLLVIVAFNLPFIYGNLKLKEIKEKNRWFVEAKSEVIIDTKAILENEKEPSRFWYLPPVVISILPLIGEMVRSYGTEMFLTSMVTIGSLAAMTILFVWISIFIKRQKAETVSSNTTLNANLTRARRHVWYQVWMGLSWLNALFVLFTWYILATDLENTLVFIIGTVLYSVVLVYVSISAEFKIRRVQRALTIHSDMDLMLDEDEYWIFGMFYYNPNDKKILKINRVGMGTTVNLATKLGKGVTIFSLLCMLSLPAISAWIIVEEFTPANVYLQENTIVCEHTKVEYEIPLEKIESVDFLTKLPRTTKINGSGMDNLCKGKYKVQGYGYCSVFYNPKLESFIILTLPDKTMVINCNTEEETQTLYKELEGKVN